MGTVGCACNHVQPLRSCPQPLQRCESHGVASETEAPLELVDTEGAILSFPLQHTKRRQATATRSSSFPTRVKDASTRAVTLTDAGAIRGMSNSPMSGGMRLTLLGGREGFV